MKILSLGIYNFLTIGKAKLTLADRGLVLIQGENLDDPSASSNGAGKSSIADALMWGLFGETARGEGGDAVVNLKTKKDCGVHVKLRDGDIFYEIQRYRKHTTLKNGTLVYAATKENFVEASDVQTLHKGTEKETQAVIEQILGCSKDVFMAAIYAGQEQTPDLPGMTDKQLKVLIEEAAGVSRLEAAYVVARSKSMAADSTLTTLKTEHTRKTTAHFNTSNDRDRAKEDYEIFEGMREVEAKQCAEKAEEHKVKARTLVLDAKKIKEEGWDKKIAVIDKKIAGIDAARTEVDDWYKAVVVPIEFKFKQQDRDIKALKAEREKVERHKVDVDAYLSEPCPTCKRPHDPKKRDEAIKTLDARWEELQAKITSAEDIQQVLSRGLTQYEAEHKAKLTALPSSTDLIVQRSAAQAHLTKVDQLVKEAKVQIEIAKRLEAEGATALTAPNPHKALLDRENKELVELNLEILDLAGKVDAATKLADISKSVVQVFSPAGVRAHILDTVTPLLNDRTADYLGTLSDGNLTAEWSTLSKTAKGELREKFCIDVANATGAQSFKGLSGGEKRKVRLACMLALQDLVATRAIKPIDLWVGDEIDDALDANGLERLMTILEVKAREKGTVLVISHNDLKDWADNVATVTKSDGIATVTGALC